MEKGREGEKVDKIPWGVTRLARINIDHVVGGERHAKSSSGDQ